MAYTKYSLTPANNTATPPDGAPEGMLPSAVNDTMRDMMAQIRDCGDGIRDGTYTMTAAKITGGTITGTTVTSNTFSSSGATITGGTINGTAIGGTTAAAGKFTTLEATGVSTFAAGTVSAPALTTTGDTNTGIFFPAADTIAFTEGGVESMRIDSSGRVLIGTTSGTRKLTVYENAAQVDLSIVSSTTGIAVIQMGDTAADNQGQIIYRNNGDSMEFAVNGAERMRIDSSGNVGIGTSSPLQQLDVASTSTSVFQTIRSTSSGATNVALRIQDGTTGTSSNDGIYLGRTGAINYLWTYENEPWVFATNTTERMRITSGGSVGIGNSSPSYTLDVTGSIRASTYFYASGGSAGHGIYLADGSTNGLISQMSNGSASTLTYIGNQTITTSSDIRIKNNIRPTERNALELLGQWEIVDHNWNDPSDQCKNNRNSRGVWTGVIAQQIQPITPWLVNKPLEDENKDGSKNLWLVDFAYSVPLLVKAIQEQQAQIEELKQEVALLKSK